MNSAAPGDDHVAPINAMYGSYTPWKAPEFPLVQPARDHTLLYRIPTNGFDKPPVALAGLDKWDNYHVKMPTSQRSVYEVDSFMMGSSSVNRWKIVEKALTKKPIKNSNDLAKVILKYNTKFETAWHFTAMHRFFNQYWGSAQSEDFFKNTMPSMIKLAVELPNIIQCPIPLLRKEQNASISISQLQIASILANAFFCTFPRRNSTGKGTEYAEYPRINFSSLYESNTDGIMEKLKCICHYFKRVCRSMPTGVVTFSRRHVPTHTCPSWEKSPVPIDSVPLHVDDHVHIEDAEGLIQVDFANKYLGGGVLGHGLVQEEIRFMICPELMAGMLFTEKLGPNDALMIIGCERYSRYEGYGRSSFRWAGDFVDHTPRDGSGRRRCAVLAIDAYNYHDQRKQYQKDMVFRELNKAWIGFSFYTDPSSTGLHYPGVATGNWGCGAFGGSPQLKSLIQLMASAQARRPIAYFTFGDARLKEEVVKAFAMLKRYNVTVGGLFKLFTKYNKTYSQLELHAFLKQELKNKNKPPPYVPAGPPAQVQMPPYPVQHGPPAYRPGYNVPGVSPPGYGFTVQSSGMYPEAQNWSPVGYAAKTRPRSSDPIQTAPRPDSPPSVPSSPSLSDIYEQSGSQSSSIPNRYYTTGTPVDQSSAKPQLKRIPSCSEIERSCRKQTSYGAANESKPAEERKIEISSRQRSKSSSYEHVDHCTASRKPGYDLACGRYIPHGSHHQGGASETAQNCKGPFKVQTEIYRASDQSNTQSKSNPYRTYQGGIEPSVMPVQSSQPRTQQPRGQDPTETSQWQTSYQADFGRPLATTHTVPMEIDPSLLSSDEDAPPQEKNQPIATKTYRFKYLWD